MPQLPKDYAPLYVPDPSHNILIQNELNRDIEALKKIVAINEAKLNKAQKETYDEILASIYNKQDTKNKLYFIDGPGVSS